MLARMLCDLGWLSVFEPQRWQSDRNAFIWEQMSLPIESKLHIAFKHISKDRALQQRLLFLEQLVVTDEMVVDQIALTKGMTTLPAGLESCFCKIQPAPETYRAAADQAQKLKSKLRNSEYGIGKNLELVPKLSQDPFWSMPEKKYHDILFKNALGSSLADSSDSLGRALFYLEFSHQLGITPTLSSGKKDWLNHFEEGIVPSVHSRIVNLFDKTISEQLSTVLLDVTGVCELAPPPVAELIVRTCLTENRALDEVTMEIRESKEAKSYRKLLATIRDSLMGGRPGIIEAAKATSALSDLAHLWGEALDPKLGVYREKRTLNFKHLPLIGKLLETASMSEVEIKDYILNSPPGYLAFISSWYDPK